MKNFIRPPELSTSFTNKGKTALDRFRNIFSDSKKNGFHITVFAVLAVLSASALVACDKKAASSIGIIGGADGPTAIFTTVKTDDNIRELYESRQEYIGNISGIGKILNKTPFAQNIGFAGSELQTREEPYGITMYYNGENTIADESDFENTAAVMLVLIKNCSNVTFKNKETNESFTFTRAQADRRFGRPVSEYAASYESFRGFMENLTVSELREKQNDKDFLIGNAIISSNKGRYLDGECAGEGHIILGEEENNRNRIFYLLTSYGEYSFRNGHFIKTGGTGVIPARLSVSETGDIIEYKVPRDGSEYVESLKEIFPREYHDRILNNDNNSDYNILKAQEHEYANAYLSSINHKKCEIGEYGDVDFVYPDNIDNDAANKLMKMFSEYPDWLGTLERVEDGIRYVYKYEWESRGDGGGIAKYTKYSYHEGDIVSETVVEVKDGELNFIKGEKRY